MIDEWIVALIVSGNLTIYVADYRGGVQISRLVHRLIIWLMQS